MSVQVYPQIIIKTSVLISIIVKVRGKSKENGDIRSFKGVNNITVRIQLYSLMCKVIEVIN
jgi:hypothetical protein